MPVLQHVVQLVDTKQHVVQLVVQHVVQPVDTKQSQTSLTPLIFEQ